MTILVTGGAGYIGSHFVRLLEKKNLEFLILDNFTTGHKDFVKNKKYLELDLKNEGDLFEKLKDENLSSIVHFAGYSLVSESQEKAEKYYNNNVLASKNLVKFALKKNVKKFIFSSSAAVYGNPEEIPIKETHVTNPINNYGKNKLEIEGFLKDISKEFPLDVVCLRYFNAAGADSKGDIGENRNPETHLIPNVINSVLNFTKLIVNGDSFDTKDGTCVRDYIHVNDLAYAHLLALDFLESNKGFHVFNLGSEKGFSNKEIISECRKLLKKEIYFEIGPSREGDPDVLVADSTKSKEKLGWKVENNSLEDIISSAINFHKNVKKI